MRRRPAQIFPENPGPGFVAQSGGDIDIPGPHGIFRICGICGEGEVSEICGQVGVGGKDFRKSPKLLPPNPSSESGRFGTENDHFGSIVVRGP
jgi:hypothetical protein